MHWPYNGGESGELIRSLDWAKTPLGPIAEWSGHLRSAVDLTLGCRHPMAVLWGPEMVQVYNDGFSRMLGGRHPGGMGQKHSDCWPEFWESTGPIYAQIFTGQSFTFENRLFPVTKDGTPGDAYFTLHYSPLRDNAGAIHGILVSIYESTGHVAVEKALRESEARFRAALEIDTMGVLFFENATGRVTDANQAFLRMAGYTLEEMKAGELRRDDLTPPEHTPGAMHVVEELVSVADSATYEKENFRRDGSSWWGLFAGKRLSEAESVEYVIDVTSRKQTEKALLQNEKLAAVGRLASSIAHEINNPLEAIINLIYLAHGSAGSSEARRYLDLAKVELDRVTQITTETLRFNRHSVRPVATKLSDVVDSVLALHQGRLRGAQINVETRYRDAQSLLCLQNEMRQVIVNLVGNAIDAMSGSHICRLLLRVRDAHDPATGRAGVRLTVADTGSGMSQATKERMFEPFYTTKQTTGTGLGLWVTQEILNKHQAILRVRSSQAPERSGTVFSIFFPHPEERSS